MMQQPHQAAHDDASVIHRLMQWEAPGPGILGLS